MSVGRPKGKKFFPVSITFTQAQIDYLAKQPNASELIRKILDDLISAGIGVNVGVISLKIQLEKLEEESVTVHQERSKFLWEKEACWKQHLGDDGNKYLDWEDSGRSIPKPLENEDAQVAFRILRGYDSQIKSLEDQINEIKKKILES